MPAIPAPPPNLTPESIAATVADELVAAIVAGVPWIARGSVKLFGPKVAAWAIGLIVLKTFGTVYPILLVLEPIAVQMFLPEIAKWFTAAKVMYAAIPPTVNGVNLAAITARQPMDVSIFKPGVNVGQVYAALGVAEAERN